MILIVRACWILFCVIWLLASFWTKQSIYKDRRGFWRYSLPLFVGAYLIFSARRFSDPLTSRVIPESLEWVGVALCVAGLLFCVWARFTLGRNWSGMVTFKGGHELITRGPYAIVRHPIYTGLLMMILGTVIGYGHIVGIIGLPFVFWGLWIKLHLEEKLMLKEFPDQYSAYQRQVKRIIPFVF